MDPHVIRSLYSTCLAHSSILFCVVCSLSLYRILLCEYATLIHSGCFQFLTDVNKWCCCYGGPCVSPSGLCVSPGGPGVSPGGLCVSPGGPSVAPGGLCVCPLEARVCPLETHGSVPWRPMGLSLDW